MKKHVFFALFISILVAGCSSSPSTSDAKSYLNNFWAPCSKTVSVSNVEKTNGVPGNDVYVLYYSYDLVFKKSILTYYDLNFTCSKKQPAGKLFDIIDKVGAVKKGGSVHVTGSINMIKSENGWIAEDM